MKALTHFSPLVYGNYTHNKGRLSSPRSLFKCNNKASDWDSTARTSHAVCFQQSVRVSFTLDHNHRVFREPEILDYIWRHQNICSTFFFSTCWFIFSFYFDRLCIYWQKLRVIKLCVDVTDFVCNLCFVCAICQTHFDNNNAHNNNNNNNKLICLKWCKHNPCLSHISLLCSRKCSNLLFYIITFL